jgi:hypothetical protein
VWTDQALHEFEHRGFAVLPGLLADEVAEVGDQLGVLFPNADEFHDDIDPRRNERFRDEFGGIVDFPFASARLGLLAVDDRLIDIASVVLGTSDLRAYSIEAWAKYTGAADYAQALHRDHLNHSLLVPADDQPASQVEMFVYLGDVPPELGPPSYVPREHTPAMPALPNFYPSADGAPDDRDPRWVSEVGRPDLYELEVAAPGPAGTVVVYRLETFHRGNALRMPRGARYTIHTNFRRADADWIGRRSWVGVANDPEWHAFVLAASPRQLELFGFPPPAHPYWTDATRRGLTERYPGRDISAWDS